MVPREEFHLEELNIKVTVAPTALRRNPSGDWTLVLDGGAEVELEDGRRVKFYGELRLKGKQYGHKPRKAKQ
jgi:hypothetical protein